MTDIRRWLARYGVFLATVAVPTLCALVYFGLIASDVYISESHFVVRNRQEQLQTTGVVGQLLQNTGLSHGEDDTMLVHDFIVSRQAALELDRELGVQKHYSNPAVDIFSRFPGLDWNGSFENFLRYYRRRISVNLDPVTSVSVLTVRAYAAGDAQRINELLLQMAERLVNQLNERSRQDLIRYAEHDVSVAADKAKEASVALYTYRSQNAIFEPNKQAELQLASIVKLQEELVETQAQIVEMTRLSPTNPQVATLQNRARSLQDAIQSESGKVTAPNSSLTAHAAKMERLLVDMAFTDKLLTAALESLETARSQALRQELYLDRLVQPSRPDYAMEPRRVRSIVTVFLVGLILWGVASLVLASIREHFD